MSPFQQPITDFSTLGDNLAYTTDKVEWWLLKYSDLYSEYKRDLPYIEDFEFPHNKGITEFMNIYQVLLMVSEVFKTKSTFSERLAAYEVIGTDKEKRIQWVEASQELFDKYQFVVFRESEESISANYGNGKYFIVRGDEFRSLSRFLEVMEEMIYN